jgi:hypothetical protein
LADFVVERNKFAFSSTSKYARRHLPHYSFRIFITRSERVADLLDRRALRSHLITIDCFANTGTAGCGVPTAKAIEQITVSEDLVTSAVAMKLSEKVRVVPRDLICLAGLTGKRRRVQGQG